MFNVLEMYQWLLEHRIVLEEQSCFYYKIPMTFKAVNSTSDGCVFRCTNTSCQKYEATKSIRSHSWLADFKVFLKQINELIGDMESKTLLGY